MRTRILILAAAALMAACGGNAGRKAATTADAPDMHTAENALDYAGIYKGTLPAADCPGIAVTLTLNGDGTYTEHNEYLERATTFDEAGAYRVDGNMLILTPADGENAFYYKIEEGRLRQLDGDKQVIEGPLAEYFILTKTTE